MAAVRRVAVLGVCFGTACTTGGEVLILSGAASPDAATAERPTETTGDSTSAPVVSLTAVSAVAAGSDQSCVLQDGDVYCSGANTFGQVGVESDAPQLRMSRSNTSKAVARVVAGYEFTCLLHADGEVACYGTNARGQLGVGGDVSQSSEPLRVDLPGPAVSLSTKFGTVCVALQGGAMYCWGANDNNQVGTGSFSPDDKALTPTVPIGADSVKSVALGRGQTCFLNQADELWCWGSNGSHELGLGPDAPGLTLEPARVSALKFIEVAPGQNHTCAITTDRELYCWGDMIGADGHPGPMGHDDQAPHDVPARVGDEADWAHVSTDTFHSCGIRGQSELWCWGRNTEGQLGMGSADVIPGRVRINPEQRFVDVAVGRFHTCALRDDGRVLCAGKNDNGELASGDQERRWTLTEVQ